MLSVAQCAAFGEYVAVIRCTAVVTIRHSDAITIWVDQPSVLSYSLWRFCLIPYRPVKKTAGTSPFDISAARQAF